MPAPSPVAAPARRMIVPTLALAGFGVFVGGVALMHVLRPDYAPARHFISDYAVGRFGAVMTSSFLAFSLGCLMLGVGMLRDGPRTWLGRIGALPLFVAAAGLVVTARFETDLPGAPYTRAGDIHSMSFIVNVNSLMLAALLSSIACGGDPRWRPFRRTASVLFGCAAVAFVLQFLSLHKGMPYGLANRLFAATLMSWLLATALWLRGLARGAT